MRTPISTAVVVASLLAFSEVAPAYGAACAQAMLVIDRTGSMLGGLDPEYRPGQKWETVVKGVKEFTVASEKKIRFGLAYYPGITCTGPFSGLGYACDVGKVVFDPKDGAAADVAAFMDMCRPMGATPTAETLGLFVDYPAFKTSKLKSHVILLLGTLACVAEVGGGRGEAEPGADGPAADRGQSAPDAAPGGETGPAPDSAPEVPPPGECPPPSGGGDLDLTPGNKTGLTLAVGSETRHYALQVPRGYDPKKCNPLLVWLHGTNDGPAPIDVEKHSIAYGKWQSSADSKGFLVALPVATKTTSTYVWSGAGTVPFVNALVDSLIAKAGVDRKRVHLVGFSSGGNFTVDVLSRESARFAAFGVHGSGLQGPFRKPARKAGVFIFVGANDPYGYVKESQALRDALKSNGWVEGENLVYQEKAGWPHDYASSTNAEQWAFYSKFVLP